MIELLAVTAHSLLPGWLLPSQNATTHGSSRWARRRELAALMRGHPVPAPDGVPLGWLGGRLAQTPAEDNALLFGVQRSGKTSAVVVPALLSWSGAVVATSTKLELVDLTADVRSRRGRVHVFAPLDPGIPAAVTWNPLDAIETVAQAAELADLFTAEGKTGPSSHWYLSAANLLAGLFVLQRERGADIGSVLRLLSTTAHAEWLIQSAAVADPLARDLLYAHALTPEREAGSIVSTARSCLSLWIDERVAAATSSGSRPFNPDRLLEEGETLYLVAPGEDAERCRPLFSALLQSLLRRATASARRLGGVLEPRLLLALDEAANFARLPRLSSYVSTGPGQGIVLLLCFHDFAQIEAGYGPEPARTIWNNCRARVLLPGQGDIQTLELFSRAIGEETRIYSTTARDSRGTSRSEQRLSRRLIAVDELRRSDEAVLLYATRAPARLRLRRWDQVPMWRSQVLGARRRALSPAPPAEEVR